MNNEDSFFLELGKLMLKHHVETIITDNGSDDRNDFLRANLITGVIHPGATALFFEDPLTSDDLTGKEVTIDPTTDGDY